MAKNQGQVVADVQKYYGECLTKSSELKTDACKVACSGAEKFTGNIGSYVANVHDEIIMKSYGCSSPIPQCLVGKTVLDLGCGTGKDVYVISQMVGPTGRVIGIDMTKQQYDTAVKYQDYHMQKFGYLKPDGSGGNVEFHLGFIEDLSKLVEDQSVDVVISNCVVNLSADKVAVFKEVHRVLKPGGELYFSDIFSDRKVPKELMKNPILLGECLSGALYFPGELNSMMEKAGFNDIRLVTSSQLKLSDKDVIEKIGMIKFYSITIRAFKGDFEKSREFYGHVAYYNGGVPSFPHEFHLDASTTFKTGYPTLVDGNVARILKNSRFAECFRVDGSFDVHMGAFEKVSSGRPGC